MKAFQFKEWLQPAESGRVKPHIEKYKLDQAVEVYDKLKNNRITGRAVLVP